MTDGNVVPEELVREAAKYGAPRLLKAWDDGEEVDATSGAGAASDDAPGPCGYFETELEYILRDFADRLLHDTCETCGDSMRPGWICNLAADDPAAENAWVRCTNSACRFGRVPSKTVEQFIVEYVRGGPTGNAADWGAHIAERERAAKADAMEKAAREFEGFVPAAGNWKRAARRLRDRAAELRGGDDGTT